MLDTSSGWRDQSLHCPHTLVPIWFAGSKSEPNWMLFMHFFLGAWVAIFHSLSLMPSGILNTDWDGKLLQLSTTRNTAVFQPLSLHVSARSWYLTFFSSWKSSVLSSQDTVSSTIITYFGYTYYRSISGQRFERVTFLRKSVPRSFASSWILSTAWNLLKCLFLYLPLSQS